MANPLPYDLTYEQILNIKLQQVSNDYNKRPGDIIYTALAPNSIEVAQMLATLQVFRDITFADTAPREELILIAVERGLSPYRATNAILRATFNIDIPIGSRFSLESVNYEAIERISFGEYRMKAEPAGSIGNNFLGQLIPVDDIPGLQSAQLVELLIPGEDEESTEALRQRYKDSFAAASFGGNRADYKTKVRGLPGVGGVRVFRAQYGAGTVGLLICDSLFKAPTQLLIDQVQEAIDPIGLQGEGVGLAPIDHVVTVTGVTETNINISTDITFAPGFDWNAVRPAAEATLNEYFSELGEEWASANTKAEDDLGLIVRISQIEFRLLSLPGVLDIADTELNGNAANLSLLVTQIPKLGTITV